MVIERRDAARRADDRDAAASAELLVQRRRGAVWRGFWYCTSRKGLERRCNALQDPDRIAYSAWAAAQPDRFTRRPTTALPVRPIRERGAACARPRLDATGP